MIITPIRLQFIPIFPKCLGERLRVQDHLFRVRLEFRLGNLLESGGNSSDGVIVWAALTSWENSLVDTLLQVLRVLQILPEENETSPGASKSLVSRGRDDITVIEWVIKLLSSDQSGRVCHIAHEPGTFAFSYGFEFAVLPVTRVRGGTADDQARLEDFSLFIEFGIIDKVGRGVCCIRQGLEING